MFCENCAHPIPDGAQFCEYCGAPIDRSAAVELKNLVESVGTSTGISPKPVSSKNEEKRNIFSEKLKAEKLLQAGR